MQFLLDIRLPSMGGSLFILPTFNCINCYKGHLCATFDVSIKPKSVAYFNQQLFHAHHLHHFIQIALLLLATYIPFLSS